MHSSFFLPPSSLYITVEGSISQEGNPVRVHFHVLASGSAGNACLLDADGFGILIDFGLPPAALLPRLRKARLSWDHIDAVVLSHTHTDHWKPTTLSQFAKLRVP